MTLDPNLAYLLDTTIPRKVDFALLDGADYLGGVAAEMQADPKKQGKAKKPDANLVSLVFPGE